MLADAEDKSVVNDETLTLWLDDVEVVALSMRSWVANQEVERWILTGVGEGQTNCERVRVVFDGVLTHISRNSAYGPDENLPSIPSCPRRS